MSIIINMEPDGIPAFFPKEQAGRAAYAASVATTMDKLPSMSLRDIRGLREKIVNDVGRNRLCKAEEASRTPTLHYYLWSREHPTLDFIFRIISIGIVHLIAEHGHAIYDKKAPIFDLVQSVAKIGNAETTKQAEVDQLKDQLFTTVRQVIFKPKNIVKNLTSLKNAQGTIDPTSASHVKNYLNRHAQQFLNSPNTYIDEELHNDILQVYSLVNLNNNHLQTLTRAKEIYTMASIWKELPFEDKLALLEEMQAAPWRFTPVLVEIINETKLLLSWDRFCEFNDAEQQQVITQVNIILEIADLDERHLLSNAITSLREDIRSSRFKSCQWDNREEVAFLKNMCDNLDLVDEFRVAHDTQEIEKAWKDIPYGQRRENTELLVADQKHYGNELEGRRKDTFALLEGIKSRPLEEYEYVVAMLRLLKPVFTEGCERALKTIETEILESIKEAEKNQNPPDDLATKARIIGIKADVLSDISNEGWIYSAVMFVVSGGKRRGQRIEEGMAEVDSDLLQKRYARREIGESTPIDHVPKAHELVKYQITESHLKVGPPSIPRLERQQADVTELTNFLRLADREGLIPDILRESTSDTSTATHRKQDVLNTLSALIEQLQNRRDSDLSDRLIKVRDVLRVYTVQVKERLKQATSKQAKCDIYNELVELVCKEMGFACFHCEDRKVNAAMLIFNEKIVGKMEESGTTQKKVLEWLAKKRDALVSGMLQEMVQEHMNSGLMGRVFSDVSSSISRWRYVMRRQLGLGDVPSPAYSIDSGLTEAQILERFKRTYTVDWILQQAMEEHAKRDDGHPLLKIIPMGEFLDSRISNFNEIRFDLLHEDDLKLLKEGMALYLQEIGVFTPIV